MTNTTWHLGDILCLRDDPATVRRFIAYNRSGLAVTVDAERRRNVEVYTKEPGDLVGVVSVVEVEEA